MVILILLVPSLYDYLLKKICERGEMGLVDVEVSWIHRNIEGYKFRTIEPIVALTKLIVALGPPFRN